MTSQKIEEIVHYHEETKHHYHRYAKSLGYMDWENQPNPFRFYEESRLIPLPLLKTDPPSGYQDLYLRHNNPLSAFSAENIAGFLELSLGLSAWKAAGTSRWSLRMNPSSGNLHPTEAHVVLPQTDTVEAGVYHYNALRHALEKRSSITGDLWKQINSYLGSSGFMIGLSSIFWRESWKYGERAFRYCNHDVGHALAGISFSANLFGWKVSYLNGLSDDAIEIILGFDKTSFTDLEEDHPDLLCFVHPSGHSDFPPTLSDEIIEAFSSLNFQGIPNILSKKRVNWEIIAHIARLTRKPATKETTFHFRDRDWICETPCRATASEIIRSRRSATDFDRNGSLDTNQFLAILDKTLPRKNRAPFDAALMEPATHLLLFVHNVKELSPGLYFFFRTDEDVNALKSITRPDYLWERVKDNFPLFLLEAGNFRQQAKMISCHQDIAGSSAFSLGMIARFNDLISKHPFRYRHLFWETGMIGQVLYLEAEAHGVRGTGIGCFFDDAVHEILGLENNQYQSLYHFTIGLPVGDPRLTTYPPYQHLDER
ncbi:MAG: SagB/ThcOx family dehydrogenase [Desulfobacterales bacterium]|jgi:SagB-type dehydrogenase family enzyme